MDTTPGHAAPHPGQDWAAACRMPAFQALVAEKRRLVRPMLFLYLAFYIGTTAICGFARDFAGRPALGPLSVGYLLIGLNFLLAWVLALLYVRFARQRFDPMAAAARAALPRTPAAPTVSAPVPVLAP